MNEVLKKIVWVILSMPRIFFYKIVNRKRANIDWFEHIESLARITFFRHTGTINMKRGCHLKRGTELHVSGKGVLEIGSHVCINSNCYIASQEKIVIGEGTEIGQNVIIVDHNHDFRCEGGIRTGNYNTEPIKIGKNVWIGANTVILKGTILEDGCVVGAGSVVSGKYSENSVIVQKRVNSVYSYRKNEK